MRALVLRGAPWSDAERAAILDYCESDVAALARLLPAMLPDIDLPRALLRGRYMVAAARIERNGVPIDTRTLGRLQRHWFDIQDQLIAAIDADYGVFEGRTFKADRFAAWLGRTRHSLAAARQRPARSERRGVSRSRAGVPGGRPVAGVARRPVRDAAVRSRRRAATAATAPCCRRSGRAPAAISRATPGSSSARACGFVGLIQPPPGHGLAYIDWAQQEFGIAAALSGDPLMLDAYRSGDPYLAFARQAGAVPAAATKATHKAVRDQFKACVLAVQYGMGADALALRIGQPPIRARELLRLHRETYRVFWRWSDAAVDHAMLTGGLHTVFGWRVQVPAHSNDRSLRNFPMQANGAEMLRLACCLATERGIEVCAPVHDAVLICAPLERLDADVARMQAPCGRRRASCSTGSSWPPTRPWCGIPTAIGTNAAPSCGSG